MRDPITAAFAILAICAAAPLAAAGQAPTIEGSWTIAQRDDRVQLTLHHEDSNWGRPVPLADLRGLSPEALASGSAHVAVSFRIEREPGSFEMTGVFHRGKGAGHFRFVPSGSFASTLRSLGIRGAERVTDRELMTLALTDLSSGRVRELAALGFTSLELRELIELAVHGVTPEYIRSIRSVGLVDAGTPRDVVALRIHGVTADYVREMAALGYTGLSRERVLELSIHGVRPELVRELRELGFRDLSVRQLLNMKIHGVSPAFIREMREAGLRDLTPETLVRMRIHGIDRDFLEARARRGG